MLSMVRNPFRFVLIVICSGIFALLDAQSVRSQSLPGVTLAPGAEATQSETPRGLDILLEEARKDGSTVIVVRPGDNMDAVVDMMATETRAQRILRARARVWEILTSVPTLWPNTKKMLQLVSPEGGYLWMVRALGTAILGFLVGWFLITRIQKWGRVYFAFMWNPNPVTTADKARYLLFRVLLAIVYAGIYFVAAMSVTVVLDPVLPGSRRLIFEVVLAYALFRIMRRAVSWNLFAYDAPTHRLVNLKDDEAILIDRDFNIAVAVALIVTATGRFLSALGEEQNFAGLTVDNVRFVQICTAAVVIVLFLTLIFKHWSRLKYILAPKDPAAWMFSFRKTIVRALPFLLVAYSVSAFIMFVYRLALDQPAPDIVLLAPFAILFAAMIVYGIVLLVIQALYDRRIRRFEELAAAERAAREVEPAAPAEADSVQDSSTSAGPEFEYRPLFRPFFENAALVIIATVALKQLGLVWGLGADEAGGPWDAALNILLAATLCWLAYNAISIYIDKKLAEEGGAPKSVDDEMGEGGGAGSSRLATLLPIARYAMVIVLFSIAGMVILSTLGFDIGPIFAGAGVVGIAVGFGAQTLIRDIFSGAFFLLDDAFRKDEYVEIDGIMGTVEKISIRSFQLRHHLGALDTIPFGEIRHLKNYSRDWVLMKLPLRVTYDTDVDRVRRLIKKLGKSLLEHPQVGKNFLQPLKSQGVYKMEDSAMIIRVKFMTKPGDQFITRKIVYESIQELFAAEGIKFAHKEVTVRLADGARASDLSEEQKKAATSAARSVIDDELAAAQANKAADDR